ANEYSDGSAGGLTSGATLVRATGLIPSTKISQDLSTATYPALNSLNPAKEKGAGDRRAMAQRASRGRPAARSAASTRSKPDRQGTGADNRTCSIVNPGDAATPPE